MSAEVLQDAGSSPSTGTRRRNLYLALASLFLWPFVDLFPYAFNLAGIGNDFHNLYYDYKVYLLDNLSRGQLPLWSPSEAAGFPFYSNPFAAAFYPLNLPLAIFYRIAGGYSVPDHQRFVILGISIFAVGLFLWLRSMKLPLHAALFAAFVMSVSFKVTELLRFPNAVHAMAWYPWILLAIHGIFAATSRRAAALHGVLLAASTICLFTAGYPYYAYYGLFLFVPYLGVFAIPKLRITLVRVESVNWKAALSTLAVATLVPVLLLSPYVYRIASLMRETTDRSGNDLTYSTDNVFDFEDTIASFVYPPAASADGWFYFGIPGVLLLLLFVFGRNDRLVLCGARAAKTVLLLWIAVISYISYGKDSRLFLMLWEHLPFFSSLRIWGRMNIVLVPILAWLLALSYMHFEATVQAARSDRKERLRCVGALSAGFLAVIGIQLYFSAHSIVDPYWTRYFVKPKAEAFPAMAEFLSTKLHLVFAISSVVAFVVILFVLLASWRRSPFGTGRPALLVLLIGISAVDTTLTGPWLWVANPKSPIRRELNVDESNRASVNTPRADGHLTIALDSTFHVGTVPNWYFERYVQFRSRAQAEDQDAYRQLMGLIDGKRLYSSSSIAHGTVREFLQDSSSLAAGLQVRSYDGDRLVADVDAPAAGYVSFIDNWDADWRAYVDGNPAAIELLFGTFKAVRVPEGKHTVTFTYQPTLWPSSTTSRLSPSGSRSR